MNKQTYLIIFPTLVLLLFLAAGAAYPKDSTGEKTTEIKAETPKNWYDDLFFKDSSFTFEGIRSLGLCIAGGGDIGECIDTMRRIKDSDDVSWYIEWKQTADRIYKMAQDFEKAGHKISAREAYFRASMYYRAAGFYMHGKDNRDKALITWKMSKESFLKGISSLNFVKPVKIPYENTTLPGYFVKTSVGGKKPPLLIVHTGFDGTGEELFFDIALPAIVRGYNCLIFEGPGQGAALREQHLYFRPDWEKVVTPVVDFALKRPDVDKNRIALMGISMGGYLAPRAVAFEHRIKACVANGGVYDFAAIAYRMPKEILDLIKTNPDQFNIEMKEGMAGNTNARWFFNNGMFTFGVDTPAELMEKIKYYNLKGLPEKIKCRMLVIQSEADTLTTGAKKLYDELVCPKDFLVFTRKETAQAHCQMGAGAISNEKIFNWLDGIMNK